MQTIAVYGSLKSGRYNNRILQDSELVGVGKVQGTLYRVSSYPALVEGGENFYDVELYKVNDVVYSHVRNMELGAGYKEIMVSFGDLGTAIVYFADDELAEYCKKHCLVIESY